jgi:hypothetical protein
MFGQRVGVCQRLERKITLTGENGLGSAYKFVDGRTGLRIQNGAYYDEAGRLRSAVTTALAEADSVSSLTNPCSPALKFWA